ncbi:2Fe-2S iron-sulfur cluster-binding protein [Sphingobium sp.]|uniref:2Fe-2S iron-sulfur cluster-binding protein n=1 Tax=Sphingobium sp. TaxID=1912891 RepID=UPI003B3B5B19
MSGYRLPHGGLIDRTAPVPFRWQGDRLNGYRGDTLASALIAAGKDIVGRSFKYHRPRGILAAGHDEPNAIIQLETGAHSTPNPKATTVELYDDLHAWPVNVHPRAERDAMAINGLFKRFIPAAFYYKTFIWPNWHLFEPAIRKAAGLGRAPVQADPDIYDQRFAHCDTLVIGGGIAGIDAARRAAAAGDQVVLVTSGRLWGGRLAGSGGDADAWIGQAMVELAEADNVTLLHRTLATGVYDHGMVALCEHLTDHKPVAARTGFRQRLWKIRAKRVVLASGAIERPLTFAQNDRPGVMLAGAAEIYARRHGVAVGRALVIATDNDSGWRSAIALAAMGLHIVAIADRRAQVATTLQAQVHALGIAVHLDRVPLSVAGRRRVKSVQLAQPGSRMGAQWIGCDTLLMAGGWNPTVHLHSQAGGVLDFDAQSGAFLPRAGTGLECVGGAAGDFAWRPDDLDMPLSARAADADGAPWTGPGKDVDGSHAWVDFQNDVTMADVALAARENFRSVEHLKRYTTLGMASDQGKTSNVVGIGILSRLLDKPVPAIGTTRFRPPFDPTTIGLFAGAQVGEGLSPVRHLPAAPLHRAAHGQMEDYGGWMRPACYRTDAETEAQAIAREVRMVRETVGLFDASPLGKIEVRGPDAALFLDRVYATSMRSVKPGRCRYGLMLSEHGNVIDDGIVARLADDHFLVGTTSGHAAGIAETLQEWLQCEWRDLRVLTEDVTTCWGVVNVAGSLARALLQRVDSDIDYDAAAFPHMAIRIGRIMDMPCRIQRVSFSGELSYEIAVPWNRTAALWSGLALVGGAMGIGPFGIEALMTMRIEKGLIHVGSETDGSTTPGDLGFLKILDAADRDFIGRRSLIRQDALRPDRRQLVGLICEGTAALPVGAHLRRVDGGAKARSEGWITSSAWSPTLNAPVALAMVEGGRSRIGETMNVWDMDGQHIATLCDPCRVDAEGAKLRG